jgi:tellurite resistance protein TerC
MFFMVSGVLIRFEKLNVGLALVLAFVGTKMLAGHWYEISIAVSLGVVASMIGASVIWSLVNGTHEPAIGAPVAKKTPGMLM